jgi:hypothetical protein
MVPFCKFQTIMRLEFKSRWYCNCQASKRKWQCYIAKRLGILPRLRRRENPAIFFILLIITWMTSNCGFSTNWTLITAIFSGFRTRYPTCVPNTMDSPFTEHTGQRSQGNGKGEGFASSSTTNGIEHGGRVNPLCAASLIKSLGSTLRFAASLIKSPGSTLRFAASPIKSPGLTLRFALS